MPTVFLLIVFLFGCGKDDDGDSSGQTPNPLSKSNWGLVAAASTAAILEFADATYQYRVLTATSNSTANVMVEMGSYTVTGNQLSLAPVQRSCPELTLNRSKTFSIVGEALTFTEASGSTQWVKQTDEQLTTSRGFVATFGCFAEDGTFTAHDLSP